MSVSDIRLDIAEQQLDTGLTLLAVHNPGVATFACAVSLDVRAGDEGDQGGLCNLVGECLDEGSEKYDGLQLAAAVETIGGALEGNTRGGVMYCPAEAQKAGTDLLREMVLRPTFPGQEVRRVQAEVLTEILADEDDPRTVAGRRFRAEVYGAHPLGRPAQGSRESVAALKPRDLRAFHGEFFRPAGGFVAAAGPDTPERMLAMLRRAFGGFRGRPASHMPLPAPALPVRSRDVHVPMAREQVHVYLGHVGVRRTDPDYYVLSVMDHVLGTGPGFTSRCSRRLRDEQGLCYAVSAGITPSAGEEPGMFTAYIGTSPEHRQQAIDGFLAEIERIRREPPTPDELADVQDYLTGSFVFGLERNSNLAAYAIRARRFGLGFDYLHRYPDLVRAVTREQVRDAAERHLHPDRMVTVSAGAS
ncbi:MAG: M16 family metallopeptidase [Planctomycetota bacterium]